MCRAQLLIIYLVNYRLSGSISIIYVPFNVVTTVVNRTKKSPFNWSNRCAIALFLLGNFVAIMLGINSSFS